MTARMVWRTATAAALALAVAGCHAAPGAPAAAPSAATPDGRSPQAILLASLPQRSSPPFRFAISGGGDTMTGVIDGRRTAARFDVDNDYPDLGYGMDMAILVLGRKAWVRIRYRPVVRDGPAVPKAWMTLDFGKATPRGGPFTYGLENDPGLAGEVFEYGSEIHATGPGRFAGLTDLSSMYGGHILTPEHLQSIKARTAPFTAVLDGQGRLSALALQIPAGGEFGATTYRVGYDEYGTAARPEPPGAGEQVSAPGWVYPLFSDAGFAGPMIRGR